MLENVSYADDHKKFGGIINPSDFNTDYRGKNTYGGSEVARRIISDHKFDEQCRKNAEGRDRTREGFSDLESLRESRENFLADFGEDGFEDDEVEEIFPPSFYISEEMKRLGLTKEEFAIRLCISNGQMSRLLSGKARITNIIARKLERETGKSRDYWMDIQNEYDFAQDLERGIAVSV